ISPISLPASNPPVKLYPNPAQEVLNIEFLERHSTSSNLMVELYDLWGKSVLRQEWGAGNSKSIPVTHLPRGVYQAIVSSDAVLIHTEKVIIIR
ncbi:MAG: T9SS type A sorting domain-containing protein, partial [Bacteroidota bacterium]